MVSTHVKPQKNPYTGVHLGVRYYKTNFQELATKISLSDFWKVG